jgi:hypothetical protein
MKRDAVLSARIPEEKRDALEAIARDEGGSLSAIVCSLVDNYLRTQRLSCRPSSEVMAAQDLMLVLADAIRDGQIDPHERIVITRQNSLLQWKLWDLKGKVG